jgi:hypothetical protein
MLKLGSGNNEEDPKGVGYGKRGVNIFVSQYRLLVVSHRP